MSQVLYSVDQVAAMLGLHVKTVRKYVRDGRLRAVRIGKQYRIAAGDLEDFTGQTETVVAGSTSNRRHAEASIVVAIDAISHDAMTRLSNMLTAAVAGVADRVRVETVYDEERATLKVILLGGLSSASELLKITDSFLEQP